MQLRTRSLLVDNIRIHFAEVGNTGPTILFIHGYLASHLEWMQVVERLEGRFRCIAIDLPGHGDSERVSPRDFSYHATAFARVIARFIEQIGANKPYVAGHSFGGTIALALAADHPEVLRRLAVLDCPCFPFSIPLKGRLSLLPGVGGLMFKYAYNKAIMLDYFRRDVWSEHPTFKPGRVDAYYSALNQPGGREAAHQTLTQLVDVAWLAPRLGRVSHPTLVGWGTDDRIVPVPTAHALVSALPDARLHLFQGACHTPAEEFPDEAARVLGDFFQE